MPFIGIIYTMRCENTTGEWGPRLLAAAFRTTVSIYDFQTRQRKHNTRTLPMNGSIIKNQ